MYFSHLLESDFALATGKHTRMTKENSKGMKDPSASNIRKVTFQGSPYNAYIWRPVLVKITYFHYYTLK